MDIVTELRYYHYSAGVLANQQHDPLCSSCKAFAHSVSSVSEGIREYEKTIVIATSAMSAGHWTLLDDAKKILAELHPVSDASGQKKAGNCLLPKGVCFVKSSKAIMDTMV